MECLALYADSTYYGRVTCLANHCLPGHPLRSIRLLGTLVAVGLGLMAIADPACARGQREDVRARMILHDDGSRTYSRLDRNTHELGETVFDQREVLVLYKQFRLDNQDRPLIGAIYEGGRNLVARIEYGYDNFGRMLEERMFNPRGQVIRRVLYIYDAQGNRTVRAMDYDPGQQAPPREVNPSEVEPTIVTPDVMGARPRKGDQVFEDGSVEVPRATTRRQRR